MKINIITLGCSKNTVDSENLAGGLKAQGHSVYFNRSQNDCDTVIINTCGFIGDAKEESINVILEQIAVKTRGRKARRLIVCGCLVERYKEELAKEMPEVDAWYGVHEWEQIVESLKFKVENAADAKCNSQLQRRLSTPVHYATSKLRKAATAVAPTVPSLSSAAHTAHVPSTTSLQKPKNW